MRRTRPGVEKTRRFRIAKRRHRFWEIAAATIEDLAVGVRSLREPDEVGQRACLSESSCAAAEKSEWRWL